ncbi:MAG: hypothetical protein GX061_08130 [Eubacteriaceae bacterium]|nr:hypothetical protein [Eubacteriaceae bacterium]
MKKIRKIASLFMVAAILSAACACGGGGEKEEEKAKSFEFTEIGTFEDIYNTLVSYAQTSGNDVMIEENTETNKLYAVYPPGTGKSMIYDAYIKMSVILSDDGSISSWGMNMPYNTDWVADGKLTPTHLLAFGQIFIRATFPEMTEEQFSEMLNSLQWPDEEVFKEAVTEGKDPGTEGGAVIIVNGGERFYTLTLIFNENHNSFQLLFMEG